MGDLLNWWKNKRRYWELKRRAHNMAEVIDKSIELFDVCVFENRVWLTYNGNIICPIEMFKDCDKIPAIIENIRGNYVRINTQE